MQRFNSHRHNRGVRREAQSFSGPSRSQNHYVNHIHMVKKKTGQQNVQILCGRGVDTLYKNPQAKPVHEGTAPLGFSHTSP